MGISRSRERELMRGMLAETKYGADVKVAHDETVSNDGCVEAYRLGEEGTGDTR